MRAGCLAGVASEVEDDLAGFAGEGFDAEVPGAGELEVDMLLEQDALEEEANGLEDGDEVDGLGTQGLAMEGEGGTGDGDDAADLGGSLLGEFDGLIGCAGVGFEQVEDVLDGFEGV